MHQLNDLLILGFINEVQSYNTPSSQDPKSQIIWAKFEQTDINDPMLYIHNQVGWLKDLYKSLAQAKLVGSKEKHGFRLPKNNSY